MKILKTLFVLAALALGSFVFAGRALAQETPDALVKRITDEVMETVRTDKEVKAGNRARIREVVETRILPYVDFQRTTAMTVGRHWREASPEQQSQLTEQFRNLLIHTYAGAMSQIGDQKLMFKPFRADPADTEVEVRFQVQRAHGGEPIQLRYRLYRSAQGWKVYDVNLLGAWLIETYKNNFSSEISRGGIDGLIRTLAEKNRSLDGRA